MKRTAIVVLNYLNYRDTIECVNSILENNYENSFIVVVDNGSANESAKILRNYYKEKKEVYVLKAGKNWGFAKGNNIGISYARKHGAEYVLVVNNDTIFQDSNMLKEMMTVEEKDTAIIGCNILLRSGFIQKPYKIYTDPIACIFRYLHALLNIRFSINSIWLEKQLKKHEQTTVLHGSCLLFTPVFFCHYKGFFDRTFLYNEEDILFFMCQTKGLEQKHTEKTTIYHKEDQASQMSFKNDEKKKQIFWLESYKYVVFWSLLAGVGIVKL